MLEQLTVEFVAFSLVGIFGVAAILLWGALKTGARKAFTTVNCTPSIPAKEAGMPLEIHLKEGIPAPLRATSILSSIDESPFYEQAIKECDGGAETRHLATWAKAFALTEGDETKAKAKYIELRAAELVSREHARKETERHEKILARQDERLKELQLAHTDLPNMTDEQRKFAEIYRVGIYLPVLIKYYGSRVSRVSAENDKQYARRLERFVSDFEKDTGIRLQCVEQGVAPYVAQSAPSGER